MSENNTEGKPSKTLALIPLFLALGLIAGVFIGEKISEKGSYNSGTFSTDDSNPSKLVNIIEYIEKNYVDSVSKTQLIDNALESILADLDPHSSYSSPEETRASREQLQGSFQGIGVEFMILRDSLVVLDPILDGPSMRAGLKPGDRIIEVDGGVVTGDTLTNALVMGMLKGPGGTKVELKIARKSEPNPLSFQITRGRIPIESVVSDYMVDTKTGYVKVVRFAQSTAKDFNLALQRLENQGASQFVIDLRSNGGGFLSQAIAMSEEFLERNDLIVFTDGVHQSKEETFARRTGSYKDFPLAVLINESSASASEIVSGALQDHDRALIVGRRSFGKGLVQNELPLPDESSIRLTIARYYTPSGRCIQKPYGDDVAYNDDYENRYDSGELFSKDSIKYADTLKYYTAGNRVVYSGGGITPDLFEPLDTNYSIALLNRVSYSGLVRRFSFDKADLSRVRVKEKHPSANLFVESWSMTEAEWSSFVDEIRGEDIPFSELDLATSRNELELRLKGQIGKYIYGDEALYRAYNENDPMMKTALDNINKPLSSLE